jgi:hypothetical protein
MSVITIFRRRRLWIAGLLAAFSIAALAQTEPRAARFMRAMKESMERMDDGMKSAPMSGDIDHDFCTTMIPHHQGAIDMAKAELLYGKNPVMRRLAEEIVVDQQSEIQAMQLWLSKQPTTTPEGRKQSRGGALNSHLATSASIALHLPRRPISNRKL